MPMYELAERAWQAYLGRPLEEPKTQPQPFESLTADEHRMLSALLVAMRDPDTWKMFSGPIKALLATELRKAARLKFVASHEKEL